MLKIIPNKIIPNAEAYDAWDNAGEELLSAIIAEKSDDNDVDIATSLTESIDSAASEICHLQYLLGDLVSNKSEAVKEKFKEYNALMKELFT